MQLDVGRAGRRGVSVSHRPQTLAASATVWGWRRGTSGRLSDLTPPKHALVYAAVGRVLRLWTAKLPTTDRCTLPEAAPILNCHVFNASRQRVPTVRRHRKPTSSGKVAVVRNVQTPPRGIPAVRDTEAVWPSAHFETGPGNEISCHEQRAIITAHHGLVACHQPCLDSPQWCSRVAGTASIRSSPPKRGRRRRHVLTAGVLQPHDISCGAPRCSSIAPHKRALEVAAKSLAAPHHVAVGLKAAATKVPVRAYATRGEGSSDHVHNVPQFAQLDDPLACVREDAMHLMTFRNAAVHVQVSNQAGPWNGNRERSEGLRRAQ
jgi:hypothetical protein